MSDALGELFRIDGRIAVVSDSGGCSSIDVVPVLLAAGAQVVLADKDPAACAALLAKVDPDGRRTLAIPIDIESEPAVIALFEAARARLGRCDILVNCAGVTANQPLTETTLAQFDALQSVNQRATFLLMREAVRLMLATGGGGRIVNISTMGTLHPVLHGNAAGQNFTGPAMDVEKRLPLGFGTGRDIAAAVLYLVGPSGGYITGQSITLDGGFLIS